VLVSCRLSIYRHSLLGHPLPARELGFPCGRLTDPSYQRFGPCRGFRVPHAQDTAGVGCPLYPGDSGVHTAAVNLRPPPAAFSTAQSLSARHNHPTRTVAFTRHQQGFPVSHPMPAFPSPVTPGRSRGPRVFPWASHPTGRNRPRTPRWGRVTDTDPRSRLRHLSTSNRRTRLRRATSRRNSLNKCPLDPADEILSKSHHPRSEGTCASEWPTPPLPYVRIWD